ncbi:PspC domain-containing protein [Arthrobacter sp.]|uniref:PspC domain-containing protein n=1 Tax=Arthrobacter sp. TaxID=1667 RepID=UPI003A8F7A70
MNHAPAESPFFRWIRGLGVHRGERSWIGGVSSGLGRRFGLDTALSRGLVLLIVIFSGVGLLLSGAAWALLPGPDGRIHAQEAGRGHWSSGMTGAVVFAAVGLLNGPLVLGGWRFNDGDSWWGELVWTVLVVGAVIWFVSSRQSRRGVSHPGNDGGAPGSAPASPAAPAPGADPQTAAWDPAGWDATTPGTEPATDPTEPGRGTWPYAPSAPGASPVTERAPIQRPAPRRPHTPPRPALSGPTVAIVLGVAVLVAGAVILTSMNSVLDYRDREVTVALAAAATVLGAGLIGASIRRLRGGALTGFTIALLVPTILVGGLGFTGSADRGWPGPVAERSGNDYTYVFNKGNLDLTHYSQDLVQDTTLSVTNVFSSLDITVPNDVPIQVTGDSAFYSLEVHTNDGVQKYSGIARDDSLDINPDATGPVLRLDIEGAFNSITITSEEATP